MVASNIKVYLRIRPSAKPSKAFSVNHEESIVTFDVDKNLQVGQVNNAKTNHKFKFDGILSMKVTQEEVFNTVAKPVIDDVLQGINGTIFAYGQTGSGKTFTITGGAERYADRGLIPRTIAYLFEAFKQRSESTFRLYISYLEIYNNDGYDLLSRDDTAQKLEELPKVMLREDDDGNIHLRNLSVNMAQKAEDALNLLFMGDTNRVVAETPMNDASTRSHCLFILWVDSTQPGSDVVRRAKLHLVDLAGSERIGRTGVEGNLQKEARYINLSLFYLEQVIVALHDKSKGRGAHVPYRNSMMTSVLRDSLGGNCKTVMVGAMAVEDRNIDESISTCTFAQRVASIKNNAIINEELDPALLIKRLKKEVAELKDELKLLSSDGTGEEALEEKDVQECQKLVSVYLEEPDGSAPFVCGSVTRFRECFRILRDTYWQRQAEGLVSGASGSGGAVGSGAAPPVGNVGVGGSGGAALEPLEAQVRKLREEVTQRDQEIGLLVHSVGRQSKGQGQDAQDAKAFASAFSQVGQLSTEKLLERHKAFEGLRKSVRRAEAAEQSRETGRKLIEEATGLGEKANAARQAINLKQSRIEKLRMERFMESSPRDPDDEGAAGASDGPEVVALLREIEEQKSIFHQCTGRLKQVKTELDNYKRTNEQNRQRLQKDFEAWCTALQGGWTDRAASTASTSLSPLEGTSARASSSTSAGLRPSRSPAPGPARTSLEARSSASTPAGLVPGRPSVSGSSRASEADSSARPSPMAAVPPRTASMGAAVRPRVTPEEQPVRAWGASPQGSPVSEASSTRASTRGAPRAGSASSAASTAAASATPAGGVKMTGHAQTDSEIAAFYAAMADLQG